MAKYYGTIGFVFTEDDGTGIYEEKRVEREGYRGEFRRITRRYENADKLTDDLNISNEISIIADPYAHLNFNHIRYASFMGTNWKITNVTVDFPRLTLTLGGEYNGPTGSKSH